MQKTALKRTGETMNFLIRWLSTSIAVAVAVVTVPGIDVVASPAWITIVIVGAVLGLINATIGQLLKVHSIGCIILTFGLINLIINALLLEFAAWISRAVFGAGFLVAGFWPAFWGGIVISVVSLVLGIFLPYDKEKL